MKDIYLKALHAIDPNWQGELVMGGKDTLCEIQTVQGNPPNWEDLFRYVAKNKEGLTAQIELEKLDTILPRHIEALMDATQQPYYRELAHAKARKEELRKIIRHA